FDSGGHRAARRDPHGSGHADRPRSGAEQRFSRARARVAVGCERTVGPCIRRRRITVHPRRASRIRRHGYGALPRPPRPPHRPAPKAEGRSRSGVAVRRPRIAVYQPWPSSIDEGWTRWVLEQYGFTFVTLHPEDLRAPLADRADVVVLADDARVPVAGAGGGGRGGGRGGRGGGGGRAGRAGNGYKGTPGGIQALQKVIRGGGGVICP